MSFRTDMTSPELDQQVQLLKHFPEIVSKHFRPLLAKNVAMLHSKIKGDIPEDTGRARAAFKKTVSGKGIFMQGRVGWWGKDAPYYINVLEYGAKPHRIVPRDPNGWLRLNGGHLVKSVDHPGVKKHAFMAQGFAALKPRVDADMAAAGEAVVKELAL